MDQLISKEALKNLACYLDVPGLNPQPEVRGRGPNIKLVHLSANGTYKIGLRYANKSTCTCIFMSSTFGHYLNKVNFFLQRHTCQGSKIHPPMSLLWSIGSQALLLSNKWNSFVVCDELYEYLATL